jgi:hypothetical protein
VCILAAHPVRGDAAVAHHHQRHVALPQHVLRDSKVEAAYKGRKPPDAEGPCCFEGG